MQFVEGRPPGRWTGPARAGYVALAVLAAHGALLLCTPLTAFLALPLWEGTRLTGLGILLYLAAFALWVLFVAGVLRIGALYVEVPAGVSSLIVALLALSGTVIALVLARPLLRAGAWELGRLLLATVPGTALGAAAATTIRWPRQSR